jgi:hypothetical protein
VVRKNIKTGDLVLKRKKNWENYGKLQEPWEGPNIAKETSMPGAFHLIDKLVKNYHIHGMQTV